MSEFADVLGLPSTVRHAPWKRGSDGKPILKPDGTPERLIERDYHLAPPDQLEVMGKWEQYLEDQAFQALLRRYRANPAMLQNAENNLNAAIVGGDYSVFGAASVKAMQSPMGPHYRKFIFFLLCPYLPEKEAEQIAEEFAKDKVAEMYRVMKSAAGETADPKLQAAPPAENGSQPSSQNSLTPVSRTPLSGAA